MSVTFAYDTLGRLIAVSDLTADTVVYEYDGIGNLLSIRRQPSTLLTIIECTPRAAPAGATVTIHGTGFGTEPAGIAVAFGGISAELKSATPTHLTVLIPDGALSGELTVSTPSAASPVSFPFEVEVPARAPLITNFSPAIGAAGTTLTVAGSGFGATSGDTKVALNRSMATVGAVTDKLIETTVPPGAASGRLTVTTPSGTGTSAEDFFVPPPSRVVEDIEFTGRVALGESLPIFVSTPARLALVLFDVIAGQRVSIGVSAVTLSASGAVHLSVLSPHGRVVLTRFVTNGGDEIDVEPLTDSGTYTVVVDPGPLTFELTLTVAAPLAGDITKDGPSIAIVLDRPGRDARFAFSAATGERVGIGVGQVTFAGGSNGVVKLSLVAPDGALLHSRLVVTAGLALDSGLMPADGIYTIVLDPQGTTPVSLTLTLSTLLTGTLALDGAPVSLNLRPGQFATLRFAGATGERACLGASEAAIGGGGAVVSIFDPGGTPLASTIVRDAGGDLDIGPLSSTGTYTVGVDPLGSPLDAGLSAAAVTMTLSRPAARPLSFGAEAVAVVLDRAGQDARLAFQGAAGERIAVRLTDVAFVDPSLTLAGRLSVIGPGDKVVGETPLVSGTTELDMESLPTDGTYTVVVDPGVFTVKFGTRVVRI